ncbi:MAG TPA: sulfotransferase [Gammaproteobacteria bacterium]|jgi:Flp pilus assembly protein TadD
MAEPTPALQNEVHRLMVEAAQHFARGGLQQAADNAAKVLQLMPEMPDALHLMGLCLLRAGDPQRAAQLMRQALQRKPADAQLLHNFGIACADAGDATGALGAFTRAAILDPRHAEARFNLGVISEGVGDPAGAEQAYRDTLELSPQHAGAAAYLASILEQRSALEEAARWNAVALTAQAEEPVANLTAAQLDIRGGRLEQGVARLERLLSQRLTPRNRALAAGRLGSAYDRLQQPDQAWPQFLAAKAALQQTQPPQGPGVYTFATAERMARRADALFEGVPSAAPTDTGAPVFLVGFPRSGTTLLDQMLSGHPSIAVLEEQDTLQDVLQAYALGDAGLEMFLGLDAAGLEPLRRAYWKRVAQFMPARPAGAVFVDKLPLNSVFMPLIHRLFPEARFIFALRDPRDVVLSCFMQSFDLNEAMQHFLSLEETARYYAAVMAAGADAEQRLGARVHRIRYEDVVADTEAEARRLLAFLDLGWDPAVLDIQKTAKGKRINTPSYSQVAEPIYTRAKERWKRYEAQLAPVLPMLAPFVKKFGYP